MASAISEHQKKTMHASTWVYSYQITQIQALDSSRLLHVDIASGPTFYPTKVKWYNEPPHTGTHFHKVPLIHCNTPPPFLSLSSFPHINLLNWAQGWQFGRILAIGCHL